MLFLIFLDGKLDDKRVSSLHKSKTLQKPILSDTVVLSFVYILVNRCIMCKKNKR